MGVTPVRLIPPPSFSGELWLWRESHHVNHVWNYTQQDCTNAFIFASSISIETCRCYKHLTTNWRNYPPYVDLKSLSSPGVIIINECCGECRAHGKSELDFSCSGNNGTSEQNRSEYLLENIDNQTDFSFPVNGYKLQNSYRGGLEYSPFVESAGVAFLTFQDSSDAKHAMFVTLEACWPVVVLSLVMAYIAGLIMWLLVSCGYYIIWFTLTHMQCSL